MIKQFIENFCLSTPGMRIHGASASPLAQQHTAFAYRTDGILSAAIGADTDMPSLATAYIPGPQVGPDGIGGTLAGALAFDDGTVAKTTNSCRFYTFYASSPVTGVAPTFGVIAGNDFPKHRPATTGDINNNIPRGNTIIGWLYLKNEGSIAFTPGTTNLDASGVTATFMNNVGALFM